MEILVRAFTHPAGKLAVVVFRDPRRQTAIAVQAPLGRVAGAPANRRQIESEQGLLRLLEGLESGFAGPGLRTAVVS